MSLINEERRNKIVSDVVDLIGDNVATEWSANAASMISSILRASGDKPAELEGQLALNYFFLEAVKKKFEVDPEIFDLELQKCYRQMEKIMEEAKRKAEEAAKEAEDPIGALMSMASAMGAEAMCAMPIESEPRLMEFPPGSEDTVTVDGEATEVESCEGTEVVGNEPENE